MTALDSGAAFFGLLETTERRLASVGELRARLRWLRGLWAALALVALLAPVAVLAGVGDPESAPGGWLAGSAVAAVAVFGLWTVVLRPAGLRLALEERRIATDVSRLREVYAHFAEREGWDDVRVRSVRRRLSAFPIGARGDGERQ
ncbi:hypothetical protein O7626_15620 [Micromonospora sp. WMMD1102]|uniref:hypothetical protein n=1 Tax=Micromonospora sp. WMMD1102 TaxID=3016105 RepID=UPI0024156897|nr:hypothetical protein [Micromonospora sp. WMMD1102]MDG4787343.1 hypothetical protein [Micromonospora sp. WMMD1102]